MCKFKTLVAALALSVVSAGAYAQSDATGWTLDSEMSKVSFASIKNDYTGESFSFGEISGDVSADGKVTIELGLASVDTMIEIRDERMVEHVFKNAPTATITAQLDMAELDGLATGQSTTLETSGTLAFLGSDTDLDATFFVMRLSDDQVMVMTDGMVMLSAEDVGINAAIDVLQELAGLDSITRVSPVTMRLFFNAGS